MASPRRSTSSLGGLLDQLNQPAPDPGFPETQRSGLPENQLTIFPVIQESRNPASQESGMPASQEPRNAKSAKATKKVTFEFDADFARTLKVQCAAEGISMRDYVVRAIRYFQESSKPGSQEARR
ncbi:MAG: hypothetical protein K6U14_07170 [Firmicutes bacterium]|nr:hypothetical protein [Alicyclobacillaceae bacterium]MCL6497399.1 hypothetical protein [Bacillota bacterium]